MNFLTLGALLLMTLTAYGFSKLVMFLFGF
jgi:hypothetical protein